MSTPSKADAAALTAFIGAFVDRLVRRGQRYDCTNPDMYERFLADVIEAANDKVTTTNGHRRWIRGDAVRAIKNDDTLSSHPMLARYAPSAASLNVERGNFSSSIDSPTRTRPLTTAEARRRAIDEDATRVLMEIEDRLKNARGS